MRGRHRWSRRTCSRFSSVWDQNETGCRLLASKDGTAPRGCCSIPCAGGMHRCCSSAALDGFSASRCAGMDAASKGIPHPRAEIGLVPTSWQASQPCTNHTGNGLREEGQVVCQEPGVSLKLWFQDPSLLSSHHWFNAFGWELSQPNPFISIWTLFL